MEVDRKLVETIADLAQLDLPEAEVRDHIESMTNVLELVEQMQRIDTTGVEPVANPLDAVQRLRTDEVTEPNERDLFQSVAPQIDAGLYLVPKVIP